MPELVAAYYTAARFICAHAASGSEPPGRLLARQLLQRGANPRDNARAIGPQREQHLAGATVRISPGMRGLASGAMKCGRHQPIIVPQQKGEGLFTEQ